MSTPPGEKALWKNCTWKTNSEKLAFFNHYFKLSSMVSERIDNEVKRIKETLIERIKEGTVKLPNNKTRPIEIRDVLEELERL